MGLDKGEGTSQDLGAPGLSAEEMKKRQEKKKRASGIGRSIYLEQATLVRGQEGLALPYMQTPTHSP